MSKWRKRLLLPIVVVCTCGLCGCESRFEAWPHSVELNGTRVNVEVAAEADQRARGLMYREEIGENWGMLFVYDKQQTLSFWMENTTIPLSIAFIDRDLVVRDIQDMRPLDGKTRHVSSVPVTYALEVNQGWFARNGIRVGTTVAFSPELEALVKDKGKGEPRGASR